MKNEIKQVIIENRENGESFIYSLPFSYKDITYCVDINGTLIAIEQIFVNSAWSHEEIYAVSNDDIFKVTIMETTDLMKELNERVDSAELTLEIAKSNNNLLIVSACEQELEKLHKEISKLNNNYHE